MWFVLLFVLINISMSNSLDVCKSQICTCDYKSEQNSDSLSINVDCRLSDITVLSNNFSLPEFTDRVVLTLNSISDVIESDFLKGSSVKELYLNKNKISNIETRALMLTELVMLDLSENELEFIDPDIFRYTKKLSYLNLASNKLTTLPDMLFHHLSAIQELNLSFNSVGNALKQKNLFQRNGLALNKGIKIISLDGIKVNNLPDNFLLDAYDLRNLTIADNNISVIPELPFTLEYLDISDNPIAQLDPEDFSELPALKTLKLNNLKIVEIQPYLFASMRTLIKIELERNANLTSFSKFAFGGQVLDDADDFLLEDLSLRGSRLTTLDKELEVPFGQLLKLDLQGNPWKCDCNLIWLKKLQIPPKDYEHLRCASPKPFYNSRIFDLKPKYFRCSKKAIIGYSTLATVCLVLFVTCIALWLMLFLPRYQSRAYGIMRLNSPNAPYTVLATDSYATAIELSTR